MSGGRQRVDIYSDLPHHSKAQSVVLLYCSQVQQIHRPGDTKIGKIDLVL